MVDKILQAAIRCFSRNGFYRTTIDDIAGELGVSKGAIYYYFQNKSDIIYQVIEKGITTINEYWVKEFSTDQPLHNLVEHVVGAFVDYSFTFPELIKVTYGGAASELDDELTARIKELKQSTINNMTHQLEYGTSINVVKKGLDYEALAVGLISMVSSICIHNMERENAPSKEIITHTICSLISGGVYIEDKSLIPKRIQL